MAELDPYADLIPKRQDPAATTAAPAPVSAADDADPYADLIPQAAAPAATPAGVPRALGDDGYDYQAVEAEAGRRTMASPLPISDLGTLDGRIVSQPSVTVTPDGASVSATPYVSPYYSYEVGTVDGRRPDMTPGQRVVRGGVLQGASSQRLAEQPLPPDGLLGELANSFGRGAASLEVAAEGVPAAVRMRGARVQRDGFVNRLRERFPDLFDGSFQIGPRTSMDLATGAAGTLADVFQLGDRAVERAIDGRNVQNQRDVQAWDDLLGAASGYMQDQAANPMSARAQRILNPLGDTLGEQAGNIASTAVSDPQAVAAALSAILPESLLQSIPTIAGGGVGAVAGGPAGAIAGASAAGGISGAVLQYVPAITDYLQQNNLQPNQLNNPKVLAAALAYADEQAAIAGGTEALAGAVGGRSLVPSSLVSSLGRRELVNELVAQPLAQGTIGAGGQAAQNVAAGQDVNVGQLLGEFLGEAAMGPLEAGPGAVARIREAARPQAQGGQQRAGSAPQVLGDLEAEEGALDPQVLARANATLQAAQAAQQPQEAPVDLGATESRPATPAPAVAPQAKPQPQAAPLVDDAVLGAFEGIEPPPAAEPAETVDLSNSSNRQGGSQQNPPQGGTAPAGGADTGPAGAGPSGAGLRVGGDDADLQPMADIAREGVNVAATADDVPADVRERMGGDLKGVEGFYDPDTGEVYVIESEIGPRSSTGMGRAERKRWVVAHEKAGHFGLRGAAVSGAGRPLAAVLEEAGTNPTVTALADAIAGPSQGRTDSELASRPLMVEEALSELAAASATGNWGHIEQRYGVKVPAAQREGIAAMIARLYQSVRRAFGLKTSNDEQVRQILRDANRYAREGAVEPTSKRGRAAAAARTEESASPPAAAAPARSAEPKPMQLPEGDVDLDAPNYGLGELPRTAEGQAVIDATPRGNTAAINTPERKAMRAEIVDQAFETAQPVAGRKPVAYVMGGGGASGKGTLLGLLRKRGLIPSADATVNVDPDEIKAELPEYGRMILAGDARAAATVHEESSDLASKIRQRAIDGGYDLVLDRTLGNVEKSLAELQQLKDAGYDVRLYGITIDPAIAIPRAVKRARRSGRYVPLSELVKAHKGFASGFERYAALADFAELFDNSGDAPVKIAGAEAGNLTVDDEQGYATFRNRSQINEKEGTIRSLQERRADRQSRVGAGDEGSRGAGRQQPRPRGEEGGREVVDHQERPAANRAPAADQTDTPAFKRWFGESEVVDSDGRPLVVYHGSHASFDRFGPGDGVSAWFSEKPDTANRYASGIGREGAQVYAAYLSIQNPAHLPFDMNASQEAVWETAREIGIADAETRWPKPEPGVIREAWRAVLSDDFIAALNEHGFDGIRVRENGQYTWGAFRPDQIKSATANRGTFDPSDSSILASRAPAQPDLRDSYGQIQEPTTAEKLREDARSTIEDLRTLRVASKPREMLAAVNRLRSIVFDSMQSRARDLEAQFPKSQALRELFDIYFEAPGYNRLVPETLPQATEARTHTFLARVERHLEASGMRLGKMTEAQNTQLRNALLGVTPLAQQAPKIRRAAELIRREMDVQRADAVEAGVDIGEVRDIGYLTRLYDDAKIKGDEAGFLADAAKHYRSAEFPREVGAPRDVLYGQGTFARFVSALRSAALADPRLADHLATLKELAHSYRFTSNVNDEAGQMGEIIREVYPLVAKDWARRRAQSWLTAIRTPDITRGFNGLLESGAPVTRARTLSGAADVNLQKWMRTDLREILQAYIGAMAGKVEEARRVGTTPDYLRNLLERAGREGVSADGLEEAVRILDTVTGSRSSSNPTWRSATEIAGAWTYLTLLGRGLFASLYETVAFTMRTGQLRHAISPLIIAGRALSAPLGNTTNQTLRRLAVDIGVNGHQAVEDAMLATHAGGEVTSKLARKTATAFFRGIWLSQLTEAQRAYGVGASVGYLKSLARQHKQAHTVGAGEVVRSPASVFFNELGIADHDEFADWILRQPATPPHAELFDADGRPTPRGHEFMIATRRLVNQSIQNVRPEHRTEWQNSSGGRIFGAIMGYSMAAYTNIIRREFNLLRTLGKDFGAGATAKRAAQFTAGAAVMYVNALLISTLREALFNQARFEDKDEEEVLKELAGLAATRTFGFGTVDPIIQLLSSLKYRKSFAETAAGATLGTALQDAQTIAEAFNDETNSPTTDTAEYRAMEAVYRSFITPLLNIALSRIPFLSGVAIPVASGSNMRKRFADLFFTRPEARSDLDDEYNKATKEVRAAKDRIEEKLGVLPKSQWAAQLRILKAEYPTLLQGLSLDVYSNSADNVARGRAGQPKTDDKGNPDLKFTAPSNGAGSLYGELEGYPRGNGKSTAGLQDKVSAMTKAINEVRKRSDITVQDLADLTEGMQGEDIDKLRERAKSGDGKKLAGSRLRNAVLEDMLASRRKVKRVVVQLIEGAQKGVKIERGQGGRMLEDARSGQ